MELNKLQIGQWYRCTQYPDYPFLPLIIGTGEISKALYFNGKPDCRIQQITNKTFWETAVEISFDGLPENYKTNVPEEYKKPKQFIPQIFN